VIGIRRCDFFMPRQNPLASSLGDQRRPPFKARFLGRLLAILIGGLGRSCRIVIDDRCGMLDSAPEEALIWAFWHNRILIVPTVWRKYLPGRSGAVLTSASKDGAFLAETLRCFGAASVRGSSSRRGAAASREMVDWVNAGYDLAITPDGPRGPRYRLAPGIVRLASKTGARILPMRVDCENAWRLKSWDQFRIPKPFSRVRVTLLPFESVAAELDGDGFEAERKRIEIVLGGDEANTAEANELS